MGKGRPQLVLAMAPVSKELLDKAYVGKEYTVLDICEEEITSCELQGVDYYFPIDCLKLVK